MASSWKSTTKAKSLSAKSCSLPIPAHVSAAPPVRAYARKPARHTDQPDGEFMKGESIYTFLSKYTADSGCNAFDGHVLACIFTVAAMESSPARPLTHALGVPERILR